MQQVRVLVFVLASLSIGKTIAAQAGQAPGHALPMAGIVTFSFNSAVLGTAEAQRDLDSLQKKLTPRQQQLQKLSDALEVEKKQLTEGNSKLTDAEKAQSISSINLKDKQLQREADNLKSDFETESQQIYQRVAQRLYVFLQKYAQQHAYAAILERGSDAAPVVWYAADNLDITEEVVKAYDHQSEAAATSLPDKPSADRPQSPIAKRP
ncbi:OmpH family outer membrane protein [Terriglobus albidus]|uniref:OmpH family outer membrane protein n=1 Tax=Terriglobus albidus TaxID=1592106 RepID=A0A5B9E938_9BACT|nr:OmpH family outer membrane protein [Terriglobus albidus]QEE27645.1 OmpH family outer membrane protein [Terriglobus albidus]